jgi:hypothetical protein
VEERGVDPSARQRLKLYDQNDTIKTQKATMDTLRANLDNMRAEAAAKEKVTEERLQEIAALLHKHITHASELEVRLKESEQQAKIFEEEQRMREEEYQQKYASLQVIA